MPVEVTARFRRQRLISPKRCSPGSFRTVKSGDHSLVVCCPRGSYKKGKCETGTIAQSLLHPKEEGNPFHDTRKALSRARKRGVYGGR